MCSQASLMEPLRKYKNWLKRTKPRWVSDMENNLTGRSSTNLGNFKSYVLQRIDENFRLYKYYNSVNMKYRKWQLKVAMKSLLDGAVRNLLALANCDGCNKWDNKDGLSPIICFGLGQFRFHPDSLHAKFISYFTVKARAMGLTVVGANEYYTSQKCPSCGRFIHEINDRVKACCSCSKYFNRDCAAAENIATLSVLRSSGQERPKHLQEPILGVDIKQALYVSVSNRGITVKEGAHYPDPMNNQ